MDEGSETPFVARLWMTPLEARNMVLGSDQVKVAEFDATYQSILNDLTTLRRLGKETTGLWKAHEQRVNSGHIARVKNGMVEVDETIDEQLLHNVETIIKNAAGTVKRFQFLTRLFGIDTGFLYQKLPNFRVGVEALARTDNALADYMVEARKWTEPIIKLRDDLEHAPFVAPRVGYAITPQGGVQALEMPVMGMPLSAFIPTLLSRLNRYVEEVLMWCVQRTASPIVVTEIPLIARNKQKPERFRLGLAGGAQPWVIIYSDDEFDRI